MKFIILSFLMIGSAFAVDYKPKVLSQLGSGSVFFLEKDIVLPANTSSYEFKDMAIGSDAYVSCVMYYDQSEKARIVKAGYELEVLKTFSHRDRLNFTSVVQFSSGFASSIRCQEFYQTGRYYYYTWSEPSYEDAEIVMSELFSISVADPTPVGH